MTPACLLLANLSQRTVFEFGRIQSNVDWVAPVLVLAAVTVFVVLMYLADCAELGAKRAALLIALRMTAFLGLFLMYLQPQWRTERQVVHPSRVVLLVDTSLSMGLADHPEDNSNRSPAAPASNRLEQVIGALEASPLLADLRRKHEVAVLTFDAEARRVASLKREPITDAKGKTSEGEVGADRIDWRGVLVPQGVETRLGQALRQVIQDERAAPVAGIAVFTDGGLNAGISHQAAAEAARDAKIPVYPIGVGSSRPPVNVRVSDFVAPTRIHPGDSFVVTGYVQGHGLDGRSVEIELVSRPAGAQANDQTGEQLLAAETLAIGADGEVTATKLPVDGIDEPGRRTLELRIKAPAQDHTPADNRQSADIEVVDRETRVLLVAGGPTREYRFLRNQLYRDQEMQVDVWLQSGGPGISQDADEVLDGFPSTKEELFAYDAIVAFDPDWRHLNEEQLGLLEQWVGEQAGGLVLVAGPIYMDKWSQEERFAKLRALYPVEFNRRFSRFDDGRYGAATPQPPRFTREGQDAEFLWIDDTSAGSVKSWEDFEGVYGYYAVRGPKPGATVYAHFADPELPAGDPQAVYMAGQFYGAGRVFYLGSGEMWRLRAVDVGHFEKFYTNLVRYVSQGRLLRGSNRGSLFVERDRYTLGASVVVRAQLTDVRLEPLEAPAVTLELATPGGQAQEVSLKADPSRKGMFTGQFTALEEGTYELALPVPESRDERLSRRIQVRVPDLERENPQRNDALLEALAKSTGGTYYVGIDSLAGKNGQHALAEQLRDMTRQTYVAGAPDPTWERNWLRWLMLGVCGALSLEWLVRRLWKLA